MLDQRQRDKVSPQEPGTENMVREIIEEARTVLPGIQALFGFQLIAVFNDGFKQLAPAEQATHFLALILIALAIALIMTPAAYHRQVEQRSVSQFFVTLASWLVATAMIPLMLGLCLEMHLLGRLIFGDARISAGIALTLLMIFAVLWFVFPWVMARRRSTEQTEQEYRRSQRP